MPVLSAHWWLNYFSCDHVEAWRLRVSAATFQYYQTPLYFLQAIIVLSLVAISYIALVALVQEDMKKLIAYSSIAHMGFVTLGTFLFSSLGIQEQFFR